MEIVKVENWCPQVKQMIRLEVEVKERNGCLIKGKPIGCSFERHCPKENRKFCWLNAIEIETRLPKYDRKYWESKTIPIDCAKFLSNEILLDGKQVLFISDRDSIFKGNENPRMALRWIHYPRKDKVQLCLAVSGTFHTEKIAYNRKEAKQWHERMWIFIPAETVKELIGFLQRNPQLLASWM